MPEREDRLQPFQRLFQGAIHQVRIDFRGGDVAMAECPLDDEQIAGATVEPGGEGMAQAVRRYGLFDPGLAEPVFEAIADLPWRQACSPLADEQGRAVLALFLAPLEIAAEQSAQMRVQEFDLRLPAFRPADIGAVMEYGATIPMPNGTTIIIPARPFLHPVMTQHKDAILEMYRDALKTALSE